MTTVTAQVRELRNAAAPPDFSSSLIPSPRAMVVPTPTTDLRYALEAMTQMMRINSEALRAVAEAQADWVKSISNVRGFFRNAAPPQPVLPEAPRRQHDDDEEDNDEEDVEQEDPAPKGLYDVLTPIAEHVAPSVGPLLTMIIGGAKGAAPSSPAGDVRDNANADLASKPNWELRDFVDLKYASEKAKAKKAAREGRGTTTATPRAKPSLQALQARVMKDPVLLAHFMTIQTLLEPHEIQRLTALAGRSSEDQLEWLIAQITPLAPDAAAALIREMLVEFDAADATKPDATPPA